MPKPLSQQLSELAVRAKHAEDEIAAAQKEAHDKVVARRNEAHAVAAAAMEKVKVGISSAGDSASGKLKALKMKVAADVDSLKARLAERKHEHDVKRADRNADWLEVEAHVAVDYAIASVEQAEVVVLDAIAGRLEAQAARRA